MAKVTRRAHVDFTIQIVSAYVSNNRVPAAALPELIASVATSFSNLISGETPDEAERQKPPVKQKPAVPIKKSVTPDYIISLEDGRKFKSLKRHLMASYGMTPDEYRTKWNLPSDYPMVAPNYAAARSTLAKKFGLGRTGKRLKSRGRKESE